MRDYPHFWPVNAYKTQKNLNFFPETGFLTTAVSSNEANKAVKMKPGVRVARLAMEACARIRLMDAQIEQIDKKTSTAKETHSALRASKN